MCNFPDICISSNGIAETDGCVALNTLSRQFNYIYADDLHLTTRMHTLLVRLVE
jgi:hypothetical protein